MQNLSNIINKNIRDSIIINNVTQILAKSSKYSDLLKSLEEKQELFDLLPIENTERRLQVGADIKEKRQEIEQFKQDILALAETFNKIEINTDRLRRAKEFFDKGEFGEARGVLETELEQMQDEQTHWLREKKHFEKDVLPNLINNAEEFFLLSMSTQINYDNPNLFEDTCKYFENSIKSYATTDNVFAYALFLQKHNQLEKAEKYYSQYLIVFSSQLSEDDQIMTSNNLANLYLDQNNYENALNEYKKALKISRKLAKTSPNIYLPHVAGVLSNLGNLHLNQYKDKNALRDYKEALEIRRKLAKTDPNVYSSDVATSLHNLANWYLFHKKYEDALKNYKKALEIRLKLAEVNPDNYLPDVAMTLNNLAVFYASQNNYEDALNECKKALKIRRKLAETDPNAYLSDVAGSLNTLANLNLTPNNYKNALQKYEEALKINRKLAKINPNTYFSDVAMVLINLAVYFQDNVVQREKSLDFAIEALIILLPYIEKIPFTQEYYNDAWSVLLNWGLIDEEIVRIVEGKMKENKQN